MRKIYPLFLLVAIIISGGFFICRDTSAKTKSVLELSSPSWQLINASWSGSSYVVAATSTAELVSPVVDLSGCSSAALAVNLSSYYSPSGSSSLAILSIAEVSGPYAELLAIAPTSTKFYSSAINIDLSAYCGKHIFIRLTTPNAQAAHGLKVSQISLSAKFPAFAVATASTSTAAVGDDIFFDGSDSGEDIASWDWSFGDGNSAVGSTTHHSYNAAGSYAINLAVFDSEGQAASTSLSLLITEKSIFSTTSAATSTEEATSTASTTTPTFSAGELLINEVYPAPYVGENEWIELYNPSSSTIDLSGWLLLNANGSHWSTTTLSGSMAAGEIKVFGDIAGSLNNSGDTVRLVAPDHTLINETSYGDFGNYQGAAWARFDSAFAITTKPTAGTTNELIAPAAKSSGSSSSSGGSSSAMVTKPLSSSTLSTTTAVLATSTTPIDYAPIIINELFPNPSDSQDNEFIELFNPNDTAVDLTGWKIGDSSTKRYIIKASSSTSNLIDPGNFAVIWRKNSAIALNNTGIESVYLYYPDGELADSVSYETKDSEDLSYSRSEAGDWQFTSFTTPGAENIFNRPDVGQVLGVKVSAAISSPAKKASAKSVQSRTIESPIEDVRLLPDNQSVITQGVVSVMPGVLGSQVFYLAGSGIQIYCNKKDFPQMQVGDLIEVKGVLAGADSERRIKIKSAGDIRIISHEAAPIPHEITTEDVSEDFEGSLVKLSGDVISISGRNITIADDAGEADTYIRSTIDIKDAGLKTGQRVTITGIVSQAKTGHRLLPRSLSDIIIAKEAATAETGKPAAAIDLNRYYPWLIAGFSIIIAGLALNRQRPRI